MCTNKQFEQLKLLKNTIIYCRKSSINVFKLDKNLILILTEKLFKYRKYQILNNSIIISLYEKNYYYPNKITRIFF